MKTVTELLSEFESRLSHLESLIGSLSISKAESKSESTTCNEPHASCKWWDGFRCRSIVANPAGYNGECPFFGPMATVTHDEPIESWACDKTEVKAGLNTKLSLKEPFNGANVGYCPECGRQVCAGSTSCECWCCQSPLYWDRVHSVWAVGEI